MYNTLTTSAKGYNVPGVSNQETFSEFIGASVEPSLKRDLEKLATKNDRTVAAEIRRALRMWVLGHQRKGEEAA